MKEMIWQDQTYETSIVNKLMTYRPMSRTLATLLAIRGIKTKEALSQYFNVSREGFHDPFLLKDMDRAVSRVLKALDAQEKIVVYGDYDVDGVTSTSVLYMFLEEVGCQVTYYIPDRHEEGYGINEDALRSIKESGGDLMISVDTGITASQQVEMGKSLGLDIIITDHHECQEVIPDALAVINPKQPDCSYPFDELAGCGVTFKLIHGIAIKLNVEALIWKYLDIVAVGTVADIVPLRGENRIITRLAFETMPTTWNQGLKALMKVSGLEGKKITAGRIGFGIGPRLNAAGRIKHAKEAVDLFISHDPVYCANVADELDRVNKDRQDLEKKIFQEAVDIIEATIDPKDKHVIVVSHDGWHHGVIGIVASRLVEKYYRPVIILAIEEGIASGSARSVDGFSIFDALMANKDLFNKFGGHEMAAGMSLPADRISILDQGLNRYAKMTMSKDVLIPKVKVDLKLDLREVTIDLIREIGTMEPFGVGNREPSFICGGQISGLKRIGQDQSHLRIIMSKEVDIVGVGFSMGDYEDQLKKGQYAECVCNLEINEWQQRLSPQMMLKDIRPADPNHDRIHDILSFHLATDYAKVENEFCRLTREDYVAFYRYLLKRDRLGLWSVPYLEIIDTLFSGHVDALAEALLMLEVFVELDLISYELLEHSFDFKLYEGKKVDLTGSKLYNKFL